jgi:hypothetical protein
MLAAAKQHLRKNICPKEEAMPSHAKILPLIGLLIAHVCSAEITPLILAPATPSESRAPDRYIIRAHEPLPNTAGTSAVARLAILNSLTGKAGEKFLFEGEGAGYVDTRFDFKRNPLWLRIWYSDKHIQIHYLDGQKGFVCTINRDGICYDNHDNYYHYVIYLRKGIRNNLTRLTKASADTSDHDQVAPSDTDDAVAAQEKP